MSLFYRTISDRRRAFTLIELLVVIGIVAILSAVVILTLNPVQLLRQARDSNRLSDYNTLNQAFNLLGIDTTQVFGVASTTYISIPDPTATSTAGTDCSGVTGLPSLPPSWTYHCAASSTYRNVNGTGWMPVNFSLMSSGAPLGTLPVDPTNNAEGGFFYAYVAGSDRYVFTISLESEKYLEKGKLALRDQGTDPTRLESGTDRLLWARATGLVGYWPLDEGMGTTAKDSSGNGGTGTWNGTGATHWATGKVGSYAGQFNGLDDYVQVTGSTGFTLSNGTIEGWINISSMAGGVSFATGGGWLDLRFVMFLGYSADGKFKFTIADGATRSTLTGSMSPNMNQWYHFAVTYDGLTQRIYVNGLLDSSLTAGLVPLTANVPLYIGRTLGLAPDFFSGLLDDVRVYNRALTAAEIQAFYNATQ